MRAEESGRGQSQPPQEDRDSIWSIPLARRALYFGLFTLYALAGIGFLIWHEVFEHTADTWQQTVLSITQGIGVTTVGAAGLALLTIEGPQTIMVVADYITERWLNPLKKRLREEHARGTRRGTRSRRGADSSRLGGMERASHGRRGQRRALRRATSRNILNRRRVIGRYGRTEAAR